jgi:hypothetical protein
MSLLWAVAIDAHAATITITNTNDSGPGSLRQAVGSAQNGDTIVFARATVSPDASPAPVGPHSQKSAGPSPRRRRVICEK